MSNVVEVLACVCLSLRVEARSCSVCRKCSAVSAVRRPPATETSSSTPRSMLTDRSMAVRCAVAKVSVYKRDGDVFQCFPVLRRLV